MLRQANTRMYLLTAKNDEPLFFYCLVVVLSLIKNYDNCDWPVR